MNQTIVIGHISELLADILDEDELSLSPETTADSVEDWDSLAQVKLILALEAQYKMTFDTSEINQSENVGELANMVLAKQQSLAG